jgi:hypothetical protein
MIIYTHARESTIVRVKSERIRGATAKPREKSPLAGARINRKIATVNKKSGKFTLVCVSVDLLHPCERSEHTQGIQTLKVSTRNWRLAAGGGERADLTFSVLLGLTPHHSRS